MTSIADGSDSLCALVHRSSHHRVDTPHKQLYLPAVYIQVQPSATGLSTPYYCSHEIFDEGWG